MRIIEEILRRDEVWCERCGNDLFVLKFMKGLVRYGMMEDTVYPVNPSQNWT